MTTCGDSDDDGVARREREREKVANYLFGGVTSWDVRRWIWRFVIRPVTMDGTRKEDGGCAEGTNAKCEERRIRVQSSTRNQRMLLCSQLVSHRSEISILPLHKL